MAKQVVKNYTINTTAKTITLVDFKQLTLGRLILITDTTLNKILYNFADSTVSTATISGNIITLNAMPGVSTTDNLRIDYDTVENDPLYDALPIINAEIEEYQDLDNRTIKVIQPAKIDAFQAGGSIATNTVIIPYQEIGDYLWMSITVNTGGAWAGSITIPQTNDQSKETNSLIYNADALNTSPATTITANGTYYIRKTAKYWRAYYSLFTSGSAATITVDYMTTPWPDFGNDFISTNMATAANQTTGNTSLSLIATNTGRNGVINHTALPTATADNTTASPMADKFGRTVTILNAPRDLISRPPQLTLTNTTETTLIAAIASVFCDITKFICVNTSTQAVRVDIRDTTGGSVVESFMVPPTDTRGAVYTVPLKQTTVNTNWTAQLSASVTDVRITAQYVQNQ